MDNDRGNLDGLPATLTITSDRVPGVVFQIRAEIDRDWLSEDHRERWRARSGPIGLEQMTSARRTEFHDGPASALVESFIDLLIAYGLDGAPAEPDQLEDIMAAIRAVVDPPVEPIDPDALNWAKTPEGQAFIGRFVADDGLALTINEAYDLWKAERLKPFWFQVGSVIRPFSIATWHYYPGTLESRSVCGIMAPKRDDNNELDTNFATFEPQGGVYVPLAVGGDICTDCKVRATLDHTPEPISVTIARDPDKLAQYVAERQASQS